jgi:hypothetical protein
MAGRCTEPAQADTITTMIHLNASPLEWVFLAISILLCVFTVFTLRDAMVDAAFLVANGVNGPRTIIADTNIREESLKLGIAVVMLIVSVVSLFLQPPPPPYSEVPQSLVATIGWCAVAALMILSSWLSRSARRRLQAYTPVEIRKTVAILPGQPSSQGLAETAKEARENTHVRKDERQAERRQG